MVGGFIGAIFGVVIAFVLDLLGVDTYVINLLHTYLNLKIDLNNFYEICSVIGIIAGICRSKDFKYTR